ncbi:hypothetical protein J6590_084881 [Homalodisca vitripennis]|nr:hypothetical protein J6590_084881 [Homalodisca vitripennis]
MDSAVEERLRCLIVSVETEERDRFRNFEETSWPHNEDFAVLDEENRTVEQFLENTNSEIDMNEEIPVHQASEVQREKKPRAQDCQKLIRLTFL